MRIRLRRLKMEIISRVVLAMFLVILTIMFIIAFHSYSKLNKLKKFKERLPFHNVSPTLLEF